MLPCFLECRFADTERFTLSEELRRLSASHRLQTIKLPDNVPYDEYVVRHADDISRMINFNWQVVARRSADIISDLIPFVDGLIAEFMHRSDALLLRGLFAEQYLPATPRRTGQSVHSIVEPDFSFVADYLIHAIAFRMGQAGGFVQSNINLVDSRNAAQPLHAHIDRGTKYTFLSCIRHSVPQVTLFARWNMFFDDPEDAKPIVDGNGNAVFDVTGDQIGLSERAIRRGYSWQEIASFCNSMYAFGSGENEFNRQVEGAAQSGWIKGVDLQEGDIMIFKNPYLIHGRAAAALPEDRWVSAVENVDARWLRAFFV
jgi:hypothetical protein